MLKTYSAALEEFWFYNPKYFVAAGCDNDPVPLVVPMLVADPFQAAADSIDFDSLLFADRLLVLPSAAAEQAS